MGINKELARVKQEFVAGDILLKALVRQEKMSIFHVASWLYRHIEHLDQLPMFLFNRELFDFHYADIPWASDVLSQITIDRVDCPIWQDGDNGYVGG